VRLVQQSHPAEKGTGDKRFDELFVKGSFELFDVHVLKEKTQRITFAGFYVKLLGIAAGTPAPFLYSDAESRVGYQRHPVWCCPFAAIASGHQPALLLYSVATNRVGYQRHPFGADES